MRAFGWIIFFILLSNVAFGQIDSLNLGHPIDSARITMDAFEEKVSTRVDSLTDPLEKVLRSNILTDSVANITLKLDSIRDQLSARVDSITGSYTSVLTELKGSALHYQSQIDSLQALKLPTEKYTAKMDSLSRMFARVQSELGEKIEGVKAKATEKIESIEYPPELAEKVSALTSSIGNLSPQTIEAKLPANLNSDKLNGFKNPLSTGKLENVANIDVPDVPEITGLKNKEGLPELNTGLSGVSELDGVSQVTGQAETIQGKVDDAAKNLNPNGVDKLAETKASQLKEVKALKEQNIALPLNPGSSEEEMKENLKEEAQKAAVDHFAGKEEQLKAAMNRIAKYKSKYSSIGSISEVVKRPPNPMRKKHWIERVVPGIGFQIQKKSEDLLVDFNPYIGYRFTGRITAGPGWNQRVAYNFDYRYFSSKGKVFGPRLFGEFKLGKGFSPRAEIEVMNTRVPPLTFIPSQDPGSRQWVWGAFVGIKKEYKIIKNIKGTASVMTRLLNPHRKSPYADVLNVRFGFELPVKKKRMGSSR